MALVHVKYGWEPKANVRSNKQNKNEPVEQGVIRVLGGQAGTGEKKTFSDYYACASYSGKIDREAVFLTADSREIPVLEDYRYRIKAGWKYFPEMALLDRLCVKGIATDQDRQFLNRAAGKRTLNVSLEEVREVIKPLVEKHPERFLEYDSAQDSVPVLKPDSAEIEKRISSSAESHQRMLEDLNESNAVCLSPGDRVLEIGFISGGYSIFAFERIGFEACGIDNCYGGLIGQPPLPGYLQKHLNSRADLRNGDITERTSFEDDSFKLIFAVSVLEHVMDMPAAFAEFRRLLAPGGVLVQSYHPFYSENGGHALGILDSPWAHVRMNRQDYLRYVKELRPFECPQAEDWIRDALNPTPMHRMQNYLVEAGFNIRSWRAGMSRQGLGGLDNRIIAEAMSHHEGITLHDLTCNNVFFAATVD